MDVAVDKPLVTESNFFIHVPALIPIVKTFIVKVQVTAVLTRVFNLKRRAFFLPDWQEA